METSITFSKEDYKTIADTIIWVAMERNKKEPFQNINSAIMAVSIEIDHYLQLFMRDRK